MGETSANNSIQCLRVYQTAMKLSIQVDNLQIQIFEKMQWKNSLQVKGIECFAFH